MRDGDVISNNSNNQTFQEVVDARMSRRRFLGSGLATAAAFSLGGVSALLKAVPVSADAIAGPLVRFQGIPVSDADTVVVPPGYTAKVLIAWGDPVSKRAEVHAGCQQQRGRSGEAVGLQ